MSKLIVVDLSAAKKAKYFSGKSARALWLARLVKYNGKSLDAFIKSCDGDKIPSLPKSGKAEKVSGWVSFFVNQDLLTFKDAPKAPAK